MDLITGEHTPNAVAAWPDMIEDAVGRLDPANDSEWQRVASALSLLLVDALLAGDSAALESAVDPLRDRLATLRNDAVEPSEARGWLLAALATVRWGLQRLPSADDLSVRENTQSRTFLDLLYEDGRRSSTQLREGIGTDHSQVSRVGRNLLASGRVIQRRAGRQAFWELTPRGQQLMRHLCDRGGGPEHGADSPAPERSSNSRTSRRHHGSRSPRSNHQSSASSRTERGLEMAGSRMLLAAQAVETRFLVEGDGRWQVKKTRDGRAVASLETKNDALRRAKEIVANEGGGKVQPVRRDGSLGKPITVQPRQRGRQKA